MAVEVSVTPTVGDRSSLTPSKAIELAKDAEVRESEWSLSWRAWRARRLPQLFRSLSEVSNPGSRSNPLLERAILQQMVRKMRNGGFYALTGQPPRPVSKRGTITKGRKKSPSKRRRGFTNDVAWEARRHITQGVDPLGRPVTRVYLPGWDHVSDIIKSACYGEAMDGSTRYAFTLRLTDKVVETARICRSGTGDGNRTMLRRCLN